MQLLRLLEVDLILSFQLEKSTLESAMLWQRKVLIYKGTVLLTRKMLLGVKKCFVRKEGV